MKCAVIDIGSNSMRLTVYEVNKRKFRVLFKDKFMAGLAGYVSGGNLTEDGIDCACEGLSDFKETLSQLKIDDISVFATASLRNIANTQQAVDAIFARTSFLVEVLPGDVEAFYSYSGAMCDLNAASGMFADIGGASTELVAFQDKKFLLAQSYPVGSLKLYRDCVTKILPGRHALKKMEDEIAAALAPAAELSAPAPLLACSGGTVRAVLKLARRRFCLPPETRSLARAQLEELFALLAADKQAAADLILKTSPERIHTLMPGMMILKSLVQAFAIEEVFVCKYGVREGYLCQRIQPGL